ncbi:MAG: glycine C-acetyltransferase [Nanoarchaeota archaeon]
MFSHKTQGHIKGTLGEIKDSGLHKEERVITSAQGTTITVGGKAVLNFCANNYLGLSNDPRIIAAAQAGLEGRGYGLSSVRFICGTQDIHKELEKRVARFVGMDDAILYSSCFDANGGFFETILGAEDAVISDALNHASIIDGVRLCKAVRKVYPHSDMDALRAVLEEVKEARIRLIVTDGVFSMQGDYARLSEICDLADEYDCLVMVDDSHATGFVGPTGKGTHEKLECMGRVDIITSTFGKALGGASGGFTAARAEIVDLLRQRSRPYLFSNSLAPEIVTATLAALDLIEKDTTLTRKSQDNATYFRSSMKKAGFSIMEGDHPIVPIMLGDAAKATKMAAAMLEEGIYVIGFSYPVVPKGEARIRVQISAAHTREQIDRCVRAFVKVRDSVAS